MHATTDILQDQFGRQHSYLRISLTEKCNLRCTYCMPEEGVALSPKSSLMTAEEILAIAKVFVANGISKIRLTGGEPLLRKDFDVILMALSQLPIELTLTTNAVLLDRHLEVLKAAQVKTINISLDTLQAEKFLHITKRDQFEKAFKNLQLAQEAGFKVKLNAVLIKDFNDDEIVDFARLTETQDLSIRFIEFMPFDGNRWDKSKLVTQETVVNHLHNYFGKDKVLSLPEEENFIARKFQIEGFKGEVGIISSVTNPFCDGCNRIRLTANGAIKNCLFSKSETNILSVFREGKSIEPIIQQVLMKKQAVRAGLDSSSAFENMAHHTHNRSMITIGG